MLRVRRHLEQAGWPRLQMSLIAALTGAFGLLCSTLLLQQGLHSMALRYPVALTIAYGMFLLLIWLWLRSQASDWADLPNLESDRPAPCGDGPPSPMTTGSGGDFHGGGASASFSQDAAPPEAPSPLADLADAAPEVDELALPLLLIALLLGLALAFCWVIYIAPTLLAEVLVDAALSYALYRYLRGQDPQHWLATTVRHTAWPFVGTAVFLAAAGAAMSAYAPGARSIGEVLKPPGTYAGKP